MGSSRRNMSRALSRHLSGIEGETLVDSQGVVDDSAFEVIEDLQLARRSIATEEVALQERGQSVEGLESGRAASDLEIAQVRQTALS